MNTLYHITIERIFRKGKFPHDHALHFRLATIAVHCMITHYTSGWPLSRSTAWSRITLQVGHYRGPPHDHALHFRLATIAVHCMITHYTSGWPLSRSTAWSRITLQVGHYRGPLHSTVCNAVWLDWNDLPFIDIWLWWLSKLRFPMIFCSISIKVILRTIQNDHLILENIVDKVHKQWPVIGCFTPGCNNRYK
jgi:hypothetical protein